MKNKQIRASPEVIDLLNKVIISFAKSDDTLLDTNTVLIKALTEMLKQNERVNATRVSLSQACQCNKRVNVTPAPGNNVTSVSMSPESPVTQNERVTVTSVSMSPESPDSGESSAGESSAGESGVTQTITYLNSALYNAALNVGYNKSVAENYVYRFEQNLQRMKTYHGTIDENEIKQLFESTIAEIRLQAN
jgi:hypothetical protein